MKIISLLRPLLAALSVFVTTAHADSPKIRVLMIDGQNNHKWAETTPLLKAILEQAGIFTVAVSTTPPGAAKPPQLPKNATPQQQAEHLELLKTLSVKDAERRAKSAGLWAAWHPHFSDYDVIVSNYNGEDWPPEVRAAFVDYVKNGGGFVCYHAADNAFPDWPEYNEMIGIGGWNHRTAKAGSYLHFKNGAWIPEQLPGPCGGHGAQNEFLVKTEAPEHPIMLGLPPQWMHAQDELYNHLRGPAKNVTVLASAVSDLTHEPEPMLMAISYGQGRVFHTTLGHYVEALNGLGFQITFARGVEWAATGKVTLPAPRPGELTDGPKAAVRELKRP